MGCGEEFRCWFCGASRSGSEVLTDALNGVALGIAEGKEFESIAEPLAVAHDGADLDGIGSKGQRDFESDDLAGFEFAGESGTNAILTDFGGASPTSAKLAVLKHPDLEAGVESEAGKTASEGNLAGGSFSGRTHAWA